MADLYDSEQDARSEARYEETDLDLMTEEAERRRWSWSEFVEVAREADREERSR